MDGLTTPQYDLACEIAYQDYANLRRTTGYERLDCLLCDSPCDEDEGLPMPLLRWADPLTRRGFVFDDTRCAWVCWECVREFGL